MILIKNNTSNNIAFEARVLSMQGQHVTVRASLLAGVTTSVDLPSGITSAMLASSPEVIAEQTKASPNWSIVSQTSESANDLSDYDVFRFIPAAVASSSYQMGVANRDIKLSRIRIVGLTVTGVAETYEVTDILVNGVGLSIAAGQRCLLPASQAANKVVTKAVSGSWTVIKAGSLIGVTTTYAAGAGTLTGVIIELIGSKS